MSLGCSVTLGAGDDDGTAVPPSPKSEGSPPSTDERAPPLDDELLLVLPNGLLS
jgi:hypothetical protein